jgi:hypothetical protein
MKNLMAVVLAFFSGFVAKKVTIASCHLLIFFLAFSGFVAKNDDSKPLPLFIYLCFSLFFFFFLFFFFGLFIAKNC